MIVLGEPKLPIEMKSNICEALQLLAHVIEEILTILIVNQSIHGCDHYQMEVDKQMSKHASMELVFDEDYQNMIGQIPRMVGISKATGELTEEPTHQAEY